MGRPPSWTDGQLREAVAASTSLKEVVSRLRAVAGGAGHRAVSVRIEVLDLDTSHFGVRASEERERAPARPRSTRRRWSDEDLAQAVADATSLHGVFQALGLVVGGHQWLVVRARIDELGLDTSHWRRPLRRARSRASWSDEDLVRELPGCRSLAELLRRLGAPDTSGSQYRRVKDRIAALELDTSDLRGQGWARGVPNPSGVTPMPLEELLVQGTLRHGRDSSGDSSERVCWNLDVPSAVASDGSMGPYPSRSTTSTGTAATTASRTSGSSARTAMP